MLQETKNKIKLAEPSAKENRKSGMIHVSVVCIKNKCPLLQRADKNSCVKSDNISFCMCCDYNCFHYKKKKQITKHLFFFA